MRNATLVALGICLLSPGRIATAYDPVGVGAWSCVAWTDTRKSLRSDTPEQWVLGFLSGIGFVIRESNDPLRGLNPQVVSEWMDKYCRRYPDESIAHGIESFSMTQEAISKSEPRKPVPR